MVASPSSSVLSSSSSTLTPTSSTPSTSTITPSTYAAATTATTVSTQPVSSHRPYPLSASAAHAGGRSIPSAAGPDAGAINPPNTSRIPVTPAVLRAIFASSRSPGEERSLSRIAFYRFSGFIISCLAISLMANQGRGIRTGAALLGVGV